jgi:hypothetical protein
MSPVGAGFNSLRKPGGDELILSDRGMQTRYISRREFMKYIVLAETRETLKGNKLALCTFHIAFNLL